MSLSVTEQHLDTGTRLAFERTQVALERTMMAWVRTATSLITFGFTIYKFFEFEAKSNSAKALLVEPKQFGLAMVTAGILALVLAGWDYVLRMRELRAQCPGLKRSRAMIIVAAIGVVGLLALLAIIF